MKTASLIKLLFIVPFFFLIVKISPAQAPPLQWHYHYGGTGHEIGFDAIEHEPGSYFLIGKTQSYGNGGYDAYILKLDQDVP